MPLWGRQRGRDDVRRPSPRPRCREGGEEAMMQRLLDSAGPSGKIRKIREIIFVDANLLQSSMHVRQIVDSADCGATEYKNLLT